LNCPGCDHQHSRVLESRVAEAGDAMRRRRECLECGARFTTYERVEQAPLWVSKHDGSQEPFDRAKLLGGLVRACNKRDVQTERLEALVIEIEATLRRRQSKAVASDAIGELALEGLFGIDLVAYVRFASVYRAFEDIDEFHAELERIAAASCSLGGRADAQTEHTNHL
jgi:transcriptional repressor NrdR